MMRGNRNTRVPQILDVAIKVFSEEGSVGFTQRRVAREVGIGLSSLQHYFATREDLLRSAIHQATERYFDEYRQMMSDTTRSPEARLERIADRIFAILTSPSTRHFSVHTWSLGEQEPSVSALLAQLHRELIVLFGGLVRTINPSLATTDCELRAGLIISHIFGLVVLMRRHESTGLDPAALQIATKAVWRALCNAPA
jgi:AcrR family transcriptional regulator